MPDESEVNCPRLKRHCDYLGEELIRKIDQCKSITDPARKQQCWRAAEGLQEALNVCREEYILNCQSPPPPPEPVRNVGIAGVEVTQSSQFFSIDGTGAGSENSLPLVSGKDTLARVYVSNSLLSARVIDGRVHLIDHGEVLEILTPLDLFTAPGNSTSARSPLEQTLNFRIPARFCKGSLDLQAFVWISGEENEVSSNSLPRNQSVFFAERAQPTLVVYRIECVSVNNSTMPPVETLHAVPDFAACQSTFDQARRMFPLNGFTVRDGGSFSYAKKVDATNLATNQADWKGIHDVITTLRNSAFPTPGVGEVYLGIMESPGNAWGFGGGNCITTFVGDSQHFAHELGHVLGCCHVADAACTPPAGGACTYPDYANTSKESGIGETGVDVDTAITLYGPDTPEIMSYCSNKWISPHHYWTAFQSPVLIPALGAPSGGATLPGEKLVFTLRIQRSDRVELMQAWHQPGQPVPIPGGTATDYMAELFTEDGRYLSGVRLQARVSEETGLEPYQDYTEVMPWDANAKTMVVLHGTVEIARFTVEDPAPPQQRVSLERHQAGHLVWDLPPNLKPFMLRFSQNGGRHWHPLPMPESGVVKWEDLPFGGDECQVELLASSGVRTLQIAGGPLNQTLGARQPHILLPEAGAAIANGAVVRLAGFVRLRPDEDPAQFDAFWTSNRDGLLADGFTGETTLSPGRHIVRLNVTSPQGQEMSATRIVQVRPALRPLVQRSRTVNPGHRPCGCGGSH